MSASQRRDTSGPMDIDDAHPLGRAAQYAVDDDGPARKRPHSDISPSPNPFTSTTPLRFGPSTPFLFHAPPLPPAPKFEPYDPNRWARVDFGYGAASSSTSNGAAPDVEMSDSPARSAPARPGNPSEGSGGSPAVAPPSEARTTEATSKEERPIAGGAVARVRRRRQKEWRRRRGSESESDGGASQKRSSTALRGPQEHHYNLHMSSAAPAVRHSEIPAILLGYVQLVFNASLVVGFLYVVLQFILAVRRDVQDRIEEYSVEILQEIASCTNAYLTNRCDPSLRVPAIAWEICMNRDPTVVGRARVGAETFAGVINSFVEPISWKTMGFTLVTLTFLIILTNSALFNLRAKHQHQHAPPPAPYPTQQSYLLQPPHYNPQSNGLGPPLPGAPNGQIGWGGKW